MTEQQRIARIVKHAGSHLKAAETSLMKAYANGVDVDPALASVLKAQAKVAALHDRLVAATS